MGGAAYACGGVVHLAGVGFGIANIFRRCFGGYVGVNHQHVVGRADMRHGREVFLWVIGQLGVQAASNVVAGCGQHHRAAVGG